MGHRRVQLSGVQPALVDLVISEWLAVRPRRPRMLRRVIAATPFKVSVFLVHSAGPLCFVCIIYFVRRLLCFPVPGLVWSGRVQTVILPRVGPPTVHVAP